MKIFRISVLLFFFLSGSFIYSQNKKAQVDSLNTNGLLAKNIKRFDLALEKKDTSGMAFALSNLGLLYQQQANYPKALDVNFRSFKLFEKIKNAEGMGKTLATISLIYQAQSDYKTALEYNLRSLKYHQQISSDKGIARNYTLIGVLYQLLNDYEKALEYDLKALEMNKALDNKIGVGKSMNNIGVVYELKGDYRNAIDYFIKGRKIASEIKNGVVTALSLKNLGSTYYSIATAKDSSFLLKNYSGNKKKVLQIAYDYIDSSSAINKGLGNLDKLKDDYILLSKIDEINGDYKNALRNYKDYSSTKDTVFNLEKDKKLVQSAMQHQFEKKEDSLKLDTDKKELEYKKEIELKALTFEYEKKQALAKTEKEKQLLKFEHQIKEQEIQNEFAHKTERSEALEKQKELERKREEVIQQAEQEKKDIQQKNIRNVFIACFVLVVVISLFIYRNYREKIRANFELSQQKELVEIKNQEITDSINYAQRIQRALLASEVLLKTHLPDYFILFRPKDIVSGDFYWGSVLHDGKFLLVTADSTGHGVPGSIMSMLNTACLKEAVESHKLSQPNQILDQTRKSIIATLANDGSAEGGKDGMDASLISFDLQNNKFTYSAANSPVWVVRGNKIIELNPDKMPVGKHERDTIPFSHHSFDLQKNDVVYALTDGLPDQFGGPKGKKFMYKQLKELLITLSPLPMETQKQKLTNVLEQWKGNLEQVDDITLIGIKI